MWNTQMKTCIIAALSALIFPDQVITLRFNQRRLSMPLFTVAILLLIVPLMAAATAAPPTIAVNGSASNAMVTPSAAMTIAVAGGPGNRTDWVGIATSGQQQNSETEYAYLVTGNETRPSVGTPGVTAATLSLAAPSAPGNYEARFY